MRMNSHVPETTSKKDYSIIGYVTLEELENPDEILHQHGDENEYLLDSDLSGAFQSVKDRFSEKLAEKGVKKC